MQTSRFECLSFYPLALFQNGFVPSEVDVCRCDVVQALVISLMVVVANEGDGVRLEITRQEVVLQQNAVWTCRAFVPLRSLTYAAFASKAKGLFQPRAECLRRGL